MPVPAGSQPAACGDGAAAGGADGGDLLLPLPSGQHGGSLFRSIGGSIISSSMLEKAYGEPGLDAEGEPLPARRPSEGIGCRSAMFALLKAYIGPAVLYLPRAWLNGGWRFTTIVLPPTAVVCAFCLSRLVACRRLAGRPVSYGELMEQACGRWGRRAVDFSVVSLQSGSCCTYFVFIASILRRTLLPSWSSPSLIVVQPLVLVPLAWIRQVHRLTLTSLLADVLILASLIAILGYEAESFGGRIGHDDPDLDVDRTLGALVSLGSLVFAYEGIALVLPIYDSLREPQQFMPLMFACVGITAVVMLLCGTLGYATFGPKTESIVLLNMPADDLFLGVQMAYALAVVFTFPLQLLPAVRILEAALFAPRERPVSLRQKVQKSAFRTVYVCLLAAVAIVGQTSFDHFVSLIGVACGIPLAFIYPCICHFQTSTSSLQRALDVIVVAGAAVVMPVVAVVNVVVWVR